MHQKWAGPGGRRRINDVPPAIGHQLCVRSVCLRCCTTPLLCPRGSLALFLLPHHAAVAHLIAPQVWPKHKFTTHHHPATAGITWHPLAPSVCL
eukprot:364051-Chlamydomonas_euryale.AAC.11